MKKAIYPGSFSPFTKGHEDVLLQAVSLFDEVIIVIGNNASKNYDFNKAARLILIDKYLKDNNIVNVKTVILKSFQATVDFAKENNIEYIIRGLRTISDFEYEIQISTMNKILNKDIKTIFFTPSLENQFTSSTMVREFISLNKDISPLVPESIKNTIYKDILNYENQK